MTLKKKFGFTLIMGFIGALLIGITNKLDAGLSIWPDATVVIRSLIATFVLMLFLMCFDKRFSRKWFIVGLVGLSLSVAMGLVTKAWPAENTVQAEKDYVAILEQAENWPLIREVENTKINGRWHKSNDSDFIALFLWFPNKDKNYQLELFAKSLYSSSNSTPDKLLKSMLKKEDGEWAVSYDNMMSFIRFNGENAIKFALFNDRNPYYPIATRVFLLKDLMPSENK